MHKSSNTVKKIPDKNSLFQKPGKISEVSNYHSSEIIAFYIQLKQCSITTYFLSNLKNTFKKASKLYFGRSIVSMSLRTAIQTNYFVPIIT